MSRLTRLAVAAFLAIAAPAAAAPSLQEIGKFSRPVDVASPPGDLRLFVVEQQTGLVKIVDQSGAILPEPFLDLRSEIAIDHNERGLLGLAFAPDYASSGLLYAFMTPPDRVEIREYRRSASDPNKAEPTGRVVLSVDHSQNGNHNGGGLRFGPDGMLWTTVGDGGGANDPDNSAQLDSTILGKLIRFDPKTATAGTADIWAKGLRNAWRFSFDRQSGDLVIGDVGQSTREEIDLAPAPGRGQGANYGWRCYEGSIDTPGVLCQPRLTGDTKPVHELTHEAPPAGDGACSITGGIVVRDPGLPSLAGRYLYGDLCLDRLRSLQLALPTATDDRAEESLPVAQVTTFAEDACGRLLVASLQGSVYRIVDGAPSMCAPPQPDPGTQPPPPSTDGRCGLTARVPKVRANRTVMRRGIHIRVGVLQSCLVRVRASIRRVGKVRAAPRTLVAGERADVRLHPRGAVRRKLRRRGSATAGVTITARSDSGQTETITRRTRIKR